MGKLKLSIRRCLNVAALTAAAVASQTAGAQQITLAAGPSGGTWYPLGVAIAKIIEREVPDTQVSVVPGVTVANILGTNAGQYDIALSLSTSNHEALKGEGKSFPQPQTKIRGIARVYSSPYQMAVRAGSDIRTVNDFKGKVINPGVVGGATDVMTQKMLKLYGLQYDDMKRVERLSYSDASMQMKDGHLDVFTAIISVPAAAISEVALGSGVRLIPIDQQAVEKLRESNPGYVGYEIPANTYKGQQESALAVGMNSVIITRSDLPKDLVAAITKAIVENAEELHTVNAALKDFGPQSAGSGIGAPLHPGAAAFYQEAGLPHETLSLPKEASGQ
jgi:TRAP transporter TAXI family solute receptor